MLHLLFQPVSFRERFSRLHLLRLNEAKVTCYAYCIGEYLDFRMSHLLESFIPDLMHPKIKKKKEVFPKA